MKHLFKLALAVTLLTTALTGCFVDIEEPVAASFNVTYNVTKQFATDTANVEYTSSSGALTVVDNFSGTAYSQTATVGTGVPVELKARDIFGEIKLSMTVERTSNKELVFDAKKTCTAAAACTLSFTTR